MPTPSLDSVIDAHLAEVQVALDEQEIAVAKALVVLARTLCAAHEPWSIRMVSWHLLVTEIIEARPELAPCLLVLKDYATDVLTADGPECPQCDHEHETGCPCVGGEQVEPEDEMGPF